MLNNSLKILSTESFLPLTTPKAINKKQNTQNEKKITSNLSRRFSSRRLARLGAIQAIYQNYYTCDDSFVISKQFEEIHFIKGNLSSLIIPNLILFNRLLKGTIQEKDRINQVIEDSLIQTWKIDRLPVLLLCFLQCALYEILNEKETPGRVIICEYMALSNEYFDRPDIDFLNGILDQFIRKFRD